MERRHRKAWVGTNYVRRWLRHGSDAAKSDELAMKDGVEKGWYGKLREKRFNKGRWCGKDWVGMLERLGLSQQNPVVLVGKERWHVAQPLPNGVR